MMFLPLRVPLRLRLVLLPLLRRMKVARTLLTK
jgi:hypothetical protein